MEVVQVDLNEPITYKTVTVKDMRGKMFVGQLPQWKNQWYLIAVSPTGEMISCYNGKIYSHGKEDDSKINVVESTINIQVSCTEVTLMVH